MGVLPNAAADINPEATYGISGNDGSISTLDQRTQDKVTAELKARTLPEDSPWRRKKWPVDQMPDGPIMWSMAQAFARSLLKQPGTTWADLSNLFTGLEFIPDTLTEHTEAITTLEEIAAAFNASPAWVTEATDMASVPRALVSTVSIVNSDSKPKFKDVLDRDQTVGYLYHCVLPTIKPVAAKSTSVGDIVYVPVVADRTGIADTVRWIVGAETSIFSIDYYEIAVSVLDPDDGNIKKVWGSGDIKDAEASVGSVGDDPDEAVITMTIDGAPIGQEIKPGQLLFVGFQQTAPGLLQTARRIAVVPEPPLSRNVPVLDAWCYVAPAHSQGIPSSISMASLTRENRYIPWASIGVKPIDLGEEEA